MTRLWMLVILATAAGLCLFPMLAKPRSGTSQKETRNEVARKFRAYLDEDWKRWMEQYPETATDVGFAGQNRHWRDDSREGIDTRISQLHESLTELKSVSRDALPAEEQLNYDLYRELLETADEGLQFGDDPAPFRDVVPGNVLMPLTQMGGIQQGKASTLAVMQRR